MIMTYVRAGVYTAFCSFGQLENCVCIGERKGKLKFSLYLRDTILEMGSMGGVGWGGSN
jgi:hypothetical protein